MPRRRVRRISREKLSNESVAFLCRVGAAEKWRRLRSDASAAQCRMARAAFYQVVWGRVPPLREHADREGE